MTPRAALAACAALGLVAAPAVAQVGNPLPVQQESRPRDASKAASSVEPYRAQGVWKSRFEDSEAKRAAAEAELEQLRSKLGQPDASAPASVPSPRSITPSSRGGGPGKAVVAEGLSPAALSTPPPPPAPVRKRRAKPAVPKLAAPPPAPVLTAPPAPPEPSPLVFGVSLAAQEEAVAKRETAVPLGSYVKARILTGVEANTIEAYPVLMQLDYAFVGPNHTRIDLSNCFMIAKAKANLSTERVLGETQQISCVRENNEIVTRPAKGYLAGEDSTFGVTGQLISNQGRVLVAAVIASLAKSAGEAIAAAQTTTTVATGGVGGVAQANNVTGNKLAYIGGRAIADPAAMIAQWYLDYAKQLVPSIAVGSGRDIWIVLLDTVKVPPIPADGGEAP